MLTLVLRLEYKHLMYNIKRIKSKVNGIKETAATMQVHQLTSRFINLFVTMTSLIFRITRLAINNLRVWHETLLRRRKLKLTRKTNL